MINLRIFSSLTGISSPARCSTIKCKSRQIIDLRQVSTAAKVLKNDGVPHLKIIAFHIPSSKLQTPLYIIIILLIIFQREIPMDTAQAAPTPPTPVTSATSPVISMGMPHTASPETWPGRPSHVPPTLPTTGCHAHARVSMLPATTSENVFATVALRAVGIVVGCRSILRWTSWKGPRRRRGCRGVRR